MPNVERSAERWLLRPLRGEDARLRLLCLPYAGGGASVFRHWPDELPAPIEVCPVQLPGRENRFLEPPFAAVGPLVEAMARALRPALDRPFALFGHSMGALIGFELIRLLTEQGGPIPERFFVSAARAPHLPRPGEPIHALPEPEFVDRLRRLGGTPERIWQDRELLEFLLPALRADFALIEGYRFTPGARLDCPISVFGGRSDSTVRPADLAGWADHAGRDFRLQMLPGNHFFLHDPAVRTHLTQSIASQLAPCIERPSPTRTGYAWPAGGALPVAEAHR